MKEKSKLPLVRWGIVFGLMILYSFFSSFLLPIFGPTVISFSGIPVAAAGWYFGPVGGFIVSLIAVILNNFLMITFGGIPWYTFDRGGFFMSAAILIMIGASIGEIKKYSEIHLRTETQLGSRERYLSLLKMATNNILNPRNVEDRHYYLITHIVNLFVADYGYFFQRETNQEGALLIVSTNTLEETQPGIILKPGESAITESILQAERTLVIDNTLYPHDIFNLTLFKNHELPIQSVLVIPIIEREYKLGIVILAFNTPRYFTPEEIDHAEESRQQIALALWNVQQEIDIKKRLRESNALAKIMRTLGETERVGLQTVLQLIVTSIKELIPGAEQAVIHLLDKEQQLLTAEAVAGYAEHDVNWKLLKFRPNSGVAGHVIVSGKTINIADVTTDPRFLASGTQPSYRSLMVAPVKTGEQKLGTISVQSRVVGAFTENERDLLSVLGTQAAIAIENAHLLETVRQALKETNALYRINQGLVALNADELLADVVDLLQKNFDYYHVQLYVIDPKTGNFNLRAGSGEIGQKLKAENHCLPAGAGIIGYAAETAAPFFTNNVDEVMFFIKNRHLPKTKSEMAIPIKIGEQILGILDIQQAPPFTFTNRDLHLVNAVADQLAVALQKAALYEDLQTSLLHEKEIRNQLVQNERLTVMGRLLASVSHELNNPLQAIQNALFLLKEEQALSLQGRQDLEIILSETDRMAAMIESLRATYRPIQAKDFSPVQINNVVEDVHALVSTHLRHNNISFEFYPDPVLPVIPGLASQMRQVILNLFMNAVEAMKGGGRLSVWTKYLESDREIFISISDNGTGINPSILPNIFDAFITNKESGTGLGLTISNEIILKHQGRISAENNSDGGATFKVWLPTNRTEIL